MCCNSGALEFVFHVSLHCTMFPLTLQCLSTQSVSLFFSFNSTLSSSTLSTNGGNKIYSVCTKKKIPIADLFSLANVILLYRLKCVSSQINRVFVPPSTSPPPSRRTLSTSSISIGLLRTTSQRYMYTIRSSISFRSSIR